MEVSLLSPNGIRAILFDLDGTLRHNRPSANHAFLDFAMRLGAQDSREKRLNAIRWAHYYWAQSAELLEDLGTFGDLSDEYWRHYAYRALVAFDCSPQQAHALAGEVHRLMTDEYEPEDWVPHDVPETLEALKCVGFPLGVVSNRTKPFDEQLATLGLQGYFSVTLAAGAVNSWKPDAVIFLQAVERLGVLPRQTLYVGDNYYADVVGARAAGLHPVLIDPEGVFPDAGCQVIRRIGELKSLTNPPIAPVQL